MSRLTAVGRAPLCRQWSVALFFLAGALTCLLPTFRGVAAQDEATPLDTPRPPVTGTFIAVPQDDTPALPDAAVHAAGQIYLQAVLRPENEVDEQVEDIMRGIIAVDPTTGKWRRLIGHGHGVRVSPDGQTLVFSHEDATWNCDTVEAAGPGRVADVRGRYSWTDNGGAFIVSAGEYIEEEGKEEGWVHETWKFSADGLTRTQLNIPETDGVEDVSPDGDWVVTVTDRHPPKGSGYQLYVMRPDGTEQRRITKDGLNVYARFSPDGQRIAYLHQDKNGNALRTVKSDGTDERTILVERGFADSTEAADWSPDGKQLAVVRFDWQAGEDGKRFVGISADANYRLEIMNADGTNARRVELEGVQVIWMGHPDWQ